MGPISVIKEALIFLPEGGCVINISSIRSLNSEPKELLYASSKSALDSVTKTLAKELGLKGIRFNTVAPGVVDTEGHREIGLTCDYKQKVIAQTPLGRLGTTIDIAKAISLLVSDKASWITGERISVAGGLL